MTHEELLAKVKPALHYPQFCANCACGKEFDEMYKLNLHIEEANNNYIFALRAVIELHKAIYDDKYQVWICDSKGCWFYPCETIEAIEKELQ